MSDQIIITILDDGTIKSESGKVSAPNHSNAEQFLLDMAKLAGGKTTRVAIGHSHSHGHAHSHEEHSH